MIDSAMTLRFSAATANLYYRSEDVSGVVHGSSCWLSRACGFNVPWNRLRRTNSGSLRRCNLIKNRIRASAKRLGPGSDPIKPNGKPQYHPFEDIAKSTSENGGDAILSSEETARTIIEVNSKATVMFSNLINDQVHENIILPELPYVTDEHGNVYFQVKGGEGTIQALTSENNFVQVIIGLDTTEMLSEMELSGPSEIDFGIDEIEEEDSDVEDEDDEEEEDSDVEDDYDGEWVAVLEDENDEEDSNEALGDWAKLETRRSSHPMYFAQKLAEVASDNPVDWMEQPPASLAIQGVVRPAFVEEHSVIQKHLSNQQSSDTNLNWVGKTVEVGSDLVGINGRGSGTESSRDSLNRAEELENDEIISNGAMFYKLEMIKIQLFSGHGHQTLVEIEDFMKAKPDPIAHSASKIISRLKAGGEKTTQALKSLCWRLKGIQVEEAVIIGVDSLGFDLRICSGTQIQTLRFAFDTRATSEYGAERQLNDVLFPRNNQKPQKVKQTRQNGC